MVSVVVTTRVQCAAPHTPLPHPCPVGHTCPHEPQLLASVSVVTQAVPHAVVPVGQVHVPLVHTRPVPHTLEQLPQVLGFARFASQPLAVLPSQSA